MKKSHVAIKLDVIGTESAKMKMAISKTIKTRGILTSNLCLNDNYYINIELFVIKDGPHAIILGLSFLNFFNEGILNYHEECITLHNEQMQFKYSMNEGKSREIIWI